MYVIQKDGEPAALQEQPYEQEEHLQSLLTRHPHLIPGDEINENVPRRWLLVGTEVGVGEEAGGSDLWSMDLLLLDQDGIPTIVEVKRSSDTRGRREVVGQVLDYAANALTSWTDETVRDKLSGTLAQAGKDMSETLAGFLMPPDGDQARSFEDYWTQVRTNLQAGRIRLIFVSDVIPRPLRTIVEFLNKYSDPMEILAVEISHYTNGDRSLKTLVPRLIGQTKAPHRPADPWDRDRFLGTIQKEKGLDDRRVAETILDWADHKAGLRPTPGNGRQDGYFSLQVRTAAATHWTIFIATTGKVYLAFDFMERGPFAEMAKRQEWLDRLNQIPGMVIGGKNLLTGEPSIRMQILHDEKRLAQFLAIMDWVVDEIMNAAAPPKLQ
jgi:hypothetical protein